MITPRQQKLLRTLWLQGPLARWELHAQTGFTPNVVGALADTLLETHLIRECSPEFKSLGRPRIPLEFDPLSRHIIGLALVPGRVEITRLSLTGDLIGDCVSIKVSSPPMLVNRASALLSSHINAETFAVGITSTGFLEPSHRSILLSSALPGRGEESMGPIFDACGDTVAILQNDSHALAARWFLTHRAEQRQDVLLVSCADGRLGAALLVDGRPNLGCMTGGNELGHMRFVGIETDKCFCGQVGCLERIMSSEYLARFDQKTSGKSENTSLVERVRNFTTSKRDPALGNMLTIFAHGLANTINLLRLHRLVLISPVMQKCPFNDELFDQIRSLTLAGLSERVQLQLWDQPSAGAAENAGWLVLADLLYGGWDALNLQPRTTARLSQIVG